MKNVIGKMLHDTLKGRYINITKEKCSVIIPESSHSLPFEIIVAIRQKQ